MRDISDILTVSFDSGLKDEVALCVSRKCGEKIVVLKMELGEQANILYRLLTEQMTKAEIKAESEMRNTNKEKFKAVFGLEIDDTSDCGFFDCTDRECKDCPVKDTKDWWNSEYKGV